LVPKDLCTSARSADAVGKSTYPSARKKRGPQDDNAKQSVVKDVDVFRTFVKASRKTRIRFTKMKLSIWN
jgi:hypothetical protein